jgi:hypothetical protein
MRARRQHVSSFISIHNGEPMFPPDDDPLAVSSPQLGDASGGSVRRLVANWGIFSPADGDCPPLFEPSTPRIEGATSPDLTYVHY